MLTASARPEAPASLLSAAEAAEAAAAWADARALYERALRTSPGTGEAEAVPLLARRIVRCLIEEANFDAAAEALEFARAAAEALRDAAGIAHATNLEGIIAQQRGDLPAAERAYRQARALADRAREALLVAMLDQNLGTVANIRGDHRAARAHYRASLRAYEQLGLMDRVGPVLNNLGMLHVDLREWESAERCFARAVAISAAAQDLPGYLRAGANRVELYIARRKFRKAKRLCRRLLAAGRSKEDAAGVWLGDTYRHLGVAHRETGDPVAAESYLRAAHQVAEQRGDLLLMAETLRELGTLHHRTGRHQECLTALTAARRLFLQLSAREEITDVAARLHSLEAQFLDIVERWGASIDDTDPYTQGHSERVAEVACQLARDAGLPDDVILWFRMGALLHDVGKITVPLAILNKRGSLTAEEWAVMQEHPAAGERLVAGAQFPWDVLPMIRHHHERWDGAGYPDRLRGESIPLTARILCIADVFDALTSTRSYRTAYSPERAMALMATDAGRAFDPVLFDTFLERTYPRLHAETSVVADVLTRSA